MKAKANGVCCCRLYSKQPADIPEVLLWESYACQVKMWLIYSGSADLDLTWGDVFDRPCEDGMTFVEVLDARFREGERHFVDATKKTGGVPGDFSVKGELPGCDSDAGFQLSGILEFFKDGQEPGPVRRFRPPELGRIRGKADIADYRHERPDAGRRVEKIERLSGVAPQGEIAGN